MVELVDTQASGACGGNPVEVRVLFPVPYIYYLLFFSQKNLSDLQKFDISLKFDICNTCISIDCINRIYILRRIVWKSQINLVDYDADASNPPYTRRL